MGGSGRGENTKTQRGGAEGRRDGGRITSGLYYYYYYYYYYTKHWQVGRKAICNMLNKLGQPSATDGELQ